MNTQPNAILLDDLVAVLQLELSTDQKDKLLKYCELLLEGLKKQRLTGEKTAGAIIGKQFYDSLYPLKLVHFIRDSKIIDLGSGAGLPGIPVKICMPENSMALLDANGKKINFLRATAKALEIDRVAFLPGRAEEWAHNNDHREKYDYVLSKAVAETTVLAELALPMLKIGGQALFYKGPRGKQEAMLAERAVDLCGGTLESVWQYKLPTGESRSLYLLRKVRETPLQYPRAVGKPARRPLY